MPATLIPALLLTAAAAAATAPTRAEYVERVEPICRQETERHEGILAGVEAMFRRDELHRAAPRVSRAATALKAAVARVAAVPRPSADAARLGRWLGYAKKGEGLLERLAATLRAGNRGRVQSLARELLRETKQANASVVGFDFDYCRVSPARFA